MILKQKTLSQKVKVTGVGLHSGKKISLTLYPERANAGIVFQRTDVSHARPIYAKSENVTETSNATTIGFNQIQISTVEHLLAAFYGLGIDNAYCEVDGPEIPIMDGSAVPFIFLIREAGVQELESSKKFIVLNKEIRVQAGDKSIHARPSTALSISAKIHFDHPLIARQEDSFLFSTKNFIDDIARARTFGMLRDVNYLKSKGLIKGGSLDNAIILDDFKILNQEGLRMQKEFVKHKILDTIGDLALLGFELIADIETYKSGHELHHLLCKKILENPKNYTIVDSTDVKSKKASSLISSPEEIILSPCIS